MPWTDYSSLEQHKYDCEQSANGSPAEYDQQAISKLQLNPLRRLYNSRFPILSNFLYTPAMLPPSIILHTSRLESAYGTQVREAAEIYARHYSNWRTAVIQQKNQEVMYGPSGIATLKYEYELASTKILMLVSEEKLLSLMFPNSNLSHPAFMHYLEENFISFGYPERDTITLPLIRANRRRCADIGLELEPMLRHIRAIADNNDLFPYKLFSLNCAQTTFNILWHGVKSSVDAALLSIFTIPWYLRLLGIPLTPNLILQQAIRAQTHIDTLGQHTSEEEKLVPRLENIEQSDLRQGVKFKLELKPQLLEFSKVDPKDCVQPQSSVATSKKIPNLSNRRRSNTV